MAYIRAYRDRWRVEVQRNGVRVSKVFDKKREAQAWALEQEAEVKRAGSGRYTFGDAVTKYAETVSSGKDGKVWEVRRLNVMRDYFGANAGLGEIDAPQIAEWRDARLKTVSGSTVVRKANLLRNVFKVSMNEWRWKEHEPFRGVKLPEENDARHQLWTWQLIRRVLRAPRIGKTAVVQLAFHIALRSAMRLQEVLEVPANCDVKRQSVTGKADNHRSCHARGSLKSRRVNCAAT